MTWLQILAQGAIFATFIGAFIAIAAYFNGKHIKEGVSEIGKMIQATQIFIKETQTLIISEMQQTRQLIEKMEENMMKLEENMMKLEENMMKLEENMMKMEENIMKILGKIYEKVS